MAEKLYQSKEWLIEQHWIFGKSMVEMARIASCSHPTIRRWMDRLGVPHRTHAEAMCRKAQDPAWQKAHAEGIRRRTQDPEWQKATAEGIRRRTQDPKYRAKIVAANRRKAQDPAWQKATAEGIRRRTQDPEWRKATAKAQRLLALKKRNRGEMTDIEAICHAAFESLDLDFVFEKFIHPYRVDFFLPSHGIIVEAMGKYWHNRPKQREHDIERKAFLEASGYIVLEWWGPDIKADVWRLIDEELLPLLDQPSRLERPPRGISKPYRGPHGWKAAIQLYLFGKEPDD